MYHPTTKLTIETKNSIENCHIVNCAPASENKAFISTMHPMINRMMDHLNCDSDQKITIKYQVCNIPMSFDYESRIDDIIYNYSIRIMQNCINDNDWTNLPNTERRNITIKTQKKIFATDKIPYYRVFNIQISKNKDIKDAYDLKSEPEWGINYTISDNSIIKSQVKGIPKTAIFQRINSLMQTMSIEPETILTEYDIALMSNERNRTHEN